jgi:hypothetical protein
MKKLGFLFHALLLIAFLIDGCTNAQSPNKIQNQITPTDESPPPMSSPIPRTEVYPPLTSTLSGITEPIESTVTAVQTDVPTLTVSQTRDYLFSALNDNGQCELPCIWGMIPGKTTPEALREILGKFEDIDTTNLMLNKMIYDDAGGLQFISNAKGKNALHILLGYFVNEANVEQVTLSGEPYGHSLTSGEWDYISFNKTFEYYTLPRILSKYGKPSKVFIWPYHTDQYDLPKDWYEFSIILLYEDQSFLIAYTSNREKKEDKFIGCPLKSIFTITSWNPEIGLTWRDAVHRLSGYGVTDSNIDELMQIDDASKLSVDEFYRRYKTPKITDCLSTPINLWTK